MRTDAPLLGHLGGGGLRETSTRCRGGSARAKKGCKEPDIIVNRVWDGEYGPAVEICSTTSALGSTACFYGAPPTTNWRCLKVSRFDVPRQPISPPADDVSHHSRSSSHIVAFGEPPRLERGAQTPSRGEAREPGRETGSSVSHYGHVPPLIVRDFTCSVSLFLVSFRTRGPLRCPATKRGGRRCESVLVRSRSAVRHTCAVICAPRAARIALRPAGLGRERAFLQRRAH